jgi:hypothetical protein
MPNIVVIGGGFAGTAAVKRLERRVPPEWRVVLISDENFMIYTPLLPEVAGASLLPGHAVAPIRKMLYRASYYRARADIGFIDGMQEHALPLKTLGDALHIRNWAVGDCAAVINARDNTLCPPMAQYAVRQAEQAADNIVRAIRGRQTRPFRYRSLGHLAAIGHRRAIAHLLGIRLSGFPAWLLWRGVYLSMLPTFLRKLQVFAEWNLDLLFPRDTTQLNLGRTCVRSAYSRVTGRPAQRSSARSSRSRETVMPKTSTKSPPLSPTRSQRRLEPSRRRDYRLKELVTAKADRRQRDGLQGCKLARKLIASQLNQVEMTGYADSWTQQLTPTRSKPANGSMPSQRFWSVKAPSARISCWNT